jgi:hypothetical protein
LLERVVRRAGSFALRGSSQSCGCLRTEDAIGDEALIALKGADRRSDRRGGHAIDRTVVRTDAREKLLSGLQPVVGRVRYLLVVEARRATAIRKRGIGRQPSACGCGGPGNRALQRRAHARLPDAIDLCPQILPYLVEQPLAAARVGVVLLDRLSASGKELPAPQPDVPLPLAGGKDDREDDEPHIARVLEKPADLDVRAVRRVEERLAHQHERHVRPGDASADLSVPVLAGHEPLVPPEFDAVAFEAFEVAEEGVGGEIRRVAVAVADEHLHRRSPPTRQTSGPRPLISWGGTLTTAPVGARVRPAARMARMPLAPGTSWLL